MPAPPNEIVGRVECRSASGVVKERKGGGDLANGVRGIMIFAVPYDSGHRALRGAGPEHLLSNGMEGVLAATGREIRSELLEVTSPFRAERTRPRRAIFAHLTPLDGETKPLAF